MAGRCTKGFYGIMGIDACLAKDRREYVDLAVAFGTNATLNAHVRAQIEAKSHLLWNRPATLPEWDQFFEEAVDQKPITNLHANKKQRRTPA